MMGDGVDGAVRLNRTYDVSGPGTRADLNDESRSEFLIVEQRHQNRRWATPDDVVS